MKYGRVARQPASWVATIMILTMISVQGCAPSESTRHVNTSSADDDGGPIATTRNGASQRKPGAPWPFWPVKMRIHPLTRVLTDQASGQLVIETRIEFQDVDGQTAKAVGALTIQLYQGSITAGSASLLKTWNTDLSDLAKNREHYDDITRTYLFRLGLDDVELADPSHLRAMFVSDDGQTFEDRWNVKR